MRKKPEPKSNHRNVNPPCMNKKVVVGLSGGIDSSMSLYFLKKQGSSPIGVSLKFCPLEKPCAKPQSFCEAQKFCKKLGVPYHVFDVNRDFKKIVLNYFFKSFKNQETPNPCVICNRFLKFPSLLKIAKKFNAPYIATGHYAQIKKIKKDFQLSKAKDKKKDQSYYLCLLNQKILGKTIFPMAGLKKTDIYKEAKKLGFYHLIQKKESQDLCFITNKNFKEYLKKILGKRPGKIIDTSGKVFGQHQGLYLYTRGQRKGLNFPHGPWFVASFQRPNILVITNQKDHPSLFKKKIVFSWRRIHQPSTAGYEIATERQSTACRNAEFPQARRMSIEEYNIISGIPILKPLLVEAKVRYRQTLQKAKIYQVGKKLIVAFKKPQAFVTPGQFCVFYQGEACLGGGKISR